MELFGGGGDFIVFMGFNESSLDLCEAAKFDIIALAGFTSLGRIIGARPGAACALQRRPPPPRDLVRLFIARKFR